MPLYEYECKQCRRRTEKIQKFSDVEITICPYCGGELERTITAPAFQFAGGGWYKDGYGNAKPPAATGGESTSDTAIPSAPAADSTSSSGETKVAPPAASPAPAASSPAPAAPSAPAKP